MTQVYARTVTGPVPVSLVAFKEYIRLPQTMVSQDGTLTAMLGNATLWGENWTRRDFRDNTWTLTMDAFPANGRICLRRDPVESITSITYLVSGVETTVDPATYYLKKGVQSSEILLVVDEEFPDDGDEIEDGREGTIVVTFDTESYSCEDDIQSAIMMHTAHLWSERGDCPAEEAAKKSGATGIYQQFRVVRV